MADYVLHVSVGDYESDRFEQQIEELIDDGTSLSLLTENRRFYVTVSSYGKE